jgi:DNA-binding NtrC family response regulator
MSPDALEVLVRLDWTENNVRELRNTVELACDFAPDGEITRKVVERVFRVQRGEVEGASGAVPPLEASARGGTGPVASLVQIRQAAFLEVLEKARDTKDPGGIAKEDTPFYRIQLEVAAHAIIEGLRASRWKLRPAARLLGISPTKLRYELKEYLEQALARCGGKLEEAAAAASIPLEVLEKKAADLGLDEVLEKGAR